MRSPVQMPLPLPVNQSLVKLWDLLSIAEESKPLVTAWLLCFTPFINVTGETGLELAVFPLGIGFW